MKLYPFLFALYPILSIYSVNISQISIYKLFLPVLIVLTIVLILQFLMNKYLNDNRKTGIFTTTFLFFIFGYGHVYNIIKDLEITNIVIGRTAYFLPIWFLTFICFICFFKNIYMKNIFEQTLNLISKLLLLLCIITILIHFYENKNIENYVLSYNKINKTQNKKKFPNIYYIILDSYGRQDVLNTFYNYDNSKFIDYLKNKGFYVANNSYSNYAYTNLSLPSILNFRYVNEIFNNSGHKFHQYIKKLIFDNEICKFLKLYNYKIIDFYKDAYCLEIKSDIYMAPDFYLDEFYIAIIDSTIIRPFLNELNKLIITTNINYFNGLKTNVDFVNNSRRNVILSAFDNLKKISNIDGPFFAFCHIIAPHGPFVFGKNGEHTFDENVITGYRNQLEFINDMTIETIDYILKKNYDNSIIVIQGDHGPPLTQNIYYNTFSLKNKHIKERMGILNAFFFPDKDYSKLNDNISPVNNFRIILNKYFGENFELLNNEYFFSFPSNNKYFQVEF